MSEPAFDYTAFKRAFETRDVERWASFFAEDGEWLEYRNHDPPRAPNRVRGRKAITQFLRGVAAAPITLALSHEVLSPHRVAFRVTIERPNGDRILEHVILELSDGKITQQVDVEAWD